MKHLYIIFACLLFGVYVYAGTYNHIIIEKDTHPAVKSAAAILAKKLNIAAENIEEKTTVSLPADGEIVMDYGKVDPEQLKFIGKDPQNTRKFLGTVGQPNNKNTCNTKGNNDLIDHVYTELGIH